LVDVACEDETPTTASSPSTPSSVSSLPDAIVLTSDP
jgi:hypothetical protein